MPAKFVLNKSRNGQFHFAVLATNGRTIAASEMYNTRAAALNGIASIQKNAAGARLEDNTTAPAAAAKKAPTKKATAKKAAAKKTPAKKTPAAKAAKKTSAKRTPATKIARPRAAKKVTQSTPDSPFATTRSIGTRAAAAVSDAADALTDRITSTAPDTART